jgi:hypothetical protein
LLLGLLAVAAAGAHELAHPHIAAVRQAHALYHKVKPLPLVDSVRYTFDAKRQLALYLFDPEQSVLYECVLAPGTNSEDSTLCFDPRQPRLAPAWTGVELDEAKRRGMTPTYRQIAETVVLATTPPFAQRTTYVLYVGERSVVRCRSTWTQYTFQHEMNGQTVYFKSEKQDDYEHNCERRFPR